MSGREGETLNFVHSDEGTWGAGLMSTHAAEVATVQAAALRTSTWRALRFNGLLTVIVWLAWALLARDSAWRSVAEHWKISVTMILGSLVGGGTSEGGAAIAFPVFTKVLHIPPADARLFSFAIQTVGMGAASLSILYQKILIERRVLAWAGSGGVLGMVLSTYLLVPWVPSEMVRVFFTAMVTSLALVLVFHGRGTSVFRTDSMRVFGPREKVILLSAGALGGTLSALIGCGENIVVFMVMVMLFRVNEKVVTPTTVLLMWMVTAAAFLLHLFVLRDVPPRVISYWLAAVPVVVVGAPLGAFLCARIERPTIVHVLVGLIAVEFLSTLLLVDMKHGVGLVGLTTLLLFAVLNWRMSRSRRYADPASPQAFRR